MPSLDFCQKFENVVIKNKFSHFLQFCCSNICLQLSFSILNKKLKKMSFGDIFFAFFFMTYFLYCLKMISKWSQSQEKKLTFPFLVIMN